MIYRLYIEPTNHCNLKCPLCSTRVGAYKQGTMNLDTFNNIIKKLQPYWADIRRVGLWGRGEPLLNPHLPEMIRILKGKGVSTVINTNGIPMDREKIIELLDVGIDNVIFSIDGLEQSTYEIYRRGGKFSKVLENLSIFIEEKRKRKVNTIIAWQFIVMKHNEHELSRVEDFAFKLGVDRVILKTVGHVDDYLVKKRLKDFLPSSKELTRMKYKDPSNKSKSCGWTDGITMFWNGDVVPCNYDVHSRFVCGNINRDDIDDMLLARQNMKMDICEECASNDMQETMMVIDRK